MDFSAELPMWHWSKVVGFSRRVAKRLGLVETWRNVALIHLITDRTAIGDPYFHHYVTLRRSSKGRRDVVIASPAVAYAKGHSFYTTMIQSWLKGELSDEYMQHAERNFDTNDDKMRMSWPKVLTDGRAVRV